MTATEWTVFVENDGKVKPYKCSICRGYSGKMQTRTVTEATGGMHKEYCIVCTVCGKKGSVHWNRPLAELTWQSEHEYIANNPQFVRKG